MFSDESVNFTVSGANPTGLLEVNRATGIEMLRFVVLEFVELPVRPVPLIVELCAPDSRGTSSESVGIGIVPDPVLGVPIDAMYRAGSVGVSLREFSPDIPDFNADWGVVERKEHPLVLTSRTRRVLVTTPNLYIDKG